jgi:hypothetical protein
MASIPNVLMYFHPRFSSCYLLLRPLYCFSLQPKLFGYLHFRYSEPIHFDRKNHILSSPLLAAPTKAMDLQVNNYSLRFK